MKKSMSANYVDQEFIPGYSHDTEVELILSRAGGLFCLLSTPSTWPGNDKCLLN